MNRVKLTNTRPHTNKKRNKSIWQSNKLNTMLYRGSFENSAVSTGTAGTISFTSSPSISSQSEYSVLQAIFTEVHLLAWKVRITATQAVNGSVLHAQAVVSVNMLYNQSVFTSPSSISSVENQTNPTTISTANVRPFVYTCKVPRLQYSNIVGDAPNPPTPFAGSPGCFQMYANNLTASTVYFDIQVMAIYALRGRQ